MVVYYFNNHYLIILLNFIYGFIILIHLNIHCKFLFLIHLREIYFNLHLMFIFFLLLGYHHMSVYKIIVHHCLIMDQLNIISQCHGWFTSTGLSSLPNRPMSPQLSSTLPSNLSSLQSVRPSFLPSLPKTSDRSICIWCIKDRLPWRFSIQTYRETIPVRVLL